jgi:hypothetical protein
VTAMPGASSARRSITIVVMLAVTGLTLAACSSSPAASNNNNSGSTTTSSSGASGAATTTTVNPGSSALAKLAGLAQSVKSAKGGTFDLTYAETSSTSAKGNTFKFEQMPPKYVFEISGASTGSIIDTGSGTYSCSTENGHAECISFGTDNPFSALIGVITGATVESQLGSLQSGLAAKLAGVSASFSSQTFAGQSAQCVSGVKGADSFKYCITQSGVLAYAGGSTATGGGSLSLTSYSTSVSPSDFALPPGATIVTE